ncbi:MAG: ThiF family adenylyltransferase [Endomicrobiia bacterium]|nr:ThiF family adenylyltransferase [Endomicrobiia bacterium]
MKLKETQIERYSRQIILDGIGGTGQKKLLAAKVAIVGAGGLGSSCAYYLAAAGVGKIIVADSDKVELNNLQRQIIHSQNVVGVQKAVSAKRTMETLNNDVEVTALPVRVAAKNVLGIVRSVDAVADCSDNFPTKYLLNDACVIARRPLVHSGILGFAGQIITINPGVSACYRCIFPTPPPAGAIPSCREAGVLGAAAGLFGALQAAEIIKIILGIGRTLDGRILVGDVLGAEFREIFVKKNPSCPVCGRRPSIKRPFDISRPVCRA